MDPAYCRAADISRLAARESAIHRTSPSGGPTVGGVRRTVVVALAVLVVVIFIVVRREPDNSPATTTPRDPVLQAAIESDIVASDSVGERILDTVDRGSCVPAGNIDLGPLAGAGAWSRVCVMGTPDGSFQQAGVNGGSDGLHLTYGDGPPAQPYSCFPDHPGPMVGVVPVRARRPSAMCRRVHLRGRSRAAPMGRALRHRSLPNGYRPSYTTAGTEGPWVGWSRW